MKVYEITITQQLVICDTPEEAKHLGFVHRDIHSEESVLAGFRAVLPGGNCYDGRRWGADTGDKMTITCLGDCDEDGNLFGPERREEVL